VADRSRFLFRTGFDRRMIDEYHGEVRWMSWGLVAASALILAQTVRADIASPGPAGDEETAQAFVQKKPDDAEGWYALGRARARRGKVEQAALAFETAIELVPTHSRAERELRALKLEGGAAELHLGRAYYNAGWWTRAEAAYAKAVEANPRSAAAHAGLAQVYLRPGPGGPYDPKKALEHARLAAELSPAPSAARLSLLAGACFANGLVDEAIDHCRRARDLEPENLGIRQQLEEYLNARRSPAPYL
jgi:cytochrome c-type biogenesis protein CcmH/NrfG